MGLLNLIRRKYLQRELVRMSKKAQSYPCYYQDFGPGHELRRLLTAWVSVSGQYMRSLEIGSPNSKALRITYQEALQKLQAYFKVLDHEKR